MCAGSVREQLQKVPVRDCAEKQGQAVALGRAQVQTRGSCVLQGLRQESDQSDHMVLPGI